MKIFEIVAAAKATNPEVFTGIPELRATKIVAAVLQEVAKQIEATQEGPVVVARFGRFNVKRVEKPAVPGSASGTVVRRVAFHLARPAETTASAKPKS